VGAVRPFRFMGEDTVLFRTEEGRPCLAEAYCPHLGAHLGHGGTVAGESIRCPFHGFRFDATGRCVATGYGGSVPPKAVLRTYPVREVQGFLLAYHHTDGEPPTWEVPEWEPDGCWLTPRSREWTIRGHPQETTENSVDLGHFTEVHGYSAVELLEGPHIEGPHLRLRYGVTRAGSFFGRSVYAELAIQAWGLGYSLVEVTVPASRLRARLLVLATPVAPHRVTLRALATVHRDHERARIHPLLGLLPRPVVNRLLLGQILKGLVHDLEQDFRIWEHKRYVQPPILADGDGPVGRYRLWARQFYPEPERGRV
jgi:nitrite reductase/ring-hydroxylating ferredoxin subunit